MQAVYSFDKQSANRIGETVLGWEQVTKEHGGSDIPYHRIPGVDIKQGLLDGALAVGGSATMSVYGYNTSGSFVDTGDDITVEWPATHGAAIASGKWVTAVYMNGKWTPIAAEC